MKRCTSRLHARTINFSSVEQAGNFAQPNSLNFRSKVNNCASQGEVEGGFELRVIRRWIGWPLSYCVFALSSRYSLHVLGSPTLSPNRLKPLPKRGIGKCQGSRLRIGAKNPWDQHFYLLYVYATRTFSVACPVRWSNLVLTLSSCRHTIRCLVVRFMNEKKKEKKM